MSCLNKLWLLTIALVGSLGLPVWADSVESYEVPVGTQEELADGTYKDLTIRGIGVIGSVEINVTNRLAIGGTPDAPAKLLIEGGWWPKIKALKDTVIGDNGGLGLVECRQSKISSVEFKSILVHALAACTPQTEYVDFFKFSSGIITLREGISNQSVYPARLLYSDSGEGHFVSGSDWGATIFREGDFVMEGCSTHQVMVKIGGGGSTFRWENNYSKLCNAAATATIQGACDALFYSTQGESVEKTLHGLELARLTCANTGDLIFSNLVTKLTGPLVLNVADSALVVAGIPEVYFDLNGQTLTGRVVRVESGDMRNTLSTGGLVFAPAAAETAAFSGVAAASLNISKDGEGTLDLSGANIGGELTVREGSVVVTSDASCATFKFEGGTLTVDGCAFEVGSWQQSGGSFSCINGGRIVRTVAAADADTWLKKPTDIPAGVTFRKTGSHACIIYDPSSAGGVDVREGVLKFSAYGRSEKYLRILFSKMSTVKTSDIVKPLTMGKVALFGADGTIPSDGAAAKADGTAADALTEKSFAYTAAKTTITTDTSYFKTPKYVFAITGTGKAVNNYCLLDAPSIDPDDPATRFGYVIRLSESSPNLVGYDFSIVGSRDHPTDWTVEGSATGADGTWTTIDTRAGQHPVKQSSTAWWGGGGVGEQALTFEFPCTYVTPGVSGLAATMDVRVDSGATADFSAVAGGQSVGALTVDATKGAGTIMNARILANGVLNVINAETASYKGVFPLALTLTDTADVDNFKSWTVSVNGVPQKCTVAWKDGQLVACPPGLILLFR